MAKKKPPEPFPGDPDDEVDDGCPKKGDEYRCNDCGLTVVVVKGCQAADSECLECCQTPMVKVGC